MLIKEKGTLNLSEVIRVQSLYDAYLDLLHKPVSEATRNHAWTEYWDFQGEVGGKVAENWNIHNLLYGIHHNRYIDENKRFKTLLAVLKAMNIIVIDDGREQ